MIRFFHLQEKLILLFNLYNNRRKLQPIKMNSFLEEGIKNEITLFFLIKNYLNS